MATSFASRTRGVAFGISGLDEATSNPLPGAEDQLAFAITTSIAFALIVWEYITFLPYEIRLYRKPVWDTIPPYAFITLRYSSIVATMPMLFLSSLKSSNCQVSASLSQVAVIIVVASSAIIFIFRTFLLWTDNRIVRGTLCGLGVVLVGCWIALATQFQAITGPTPPFGSNCHILPTVPWLPVGNAAATVFFLALLVLSLLKMRYHDRRDSLVAYRIYRAYICYVVGIAVTSATALVLQSVSPPSSALSLCTASLALVFTTTLSTRAFRNFMLARVLETEGRDGLPYPSTSPIISHASEARYAHRPPTSPRFATATPAAVNFKPLPIEPRPRMASLAAPPNPKPNPKLSPYTTFPSPPSSQAGHSPFSAPPPPPPPATVTAPSPTSGSYTARSVISSSPSNSAFSASSPPQPPAPPYSRSVISSSPSSSAFSASSPPQTLAPLRRGMVRNERTREPPMSAWSDT